MRSIFAPLVCAPFACAQVTIHYPGYFHSSVRPLSTLKEDHKVVAASGSASTAQPSEIPDSVPVNTTTNADLKTLLPTQHPEHPVEHPVEQGTGNLLYQISMQLMTQIS
jgi:hypothetical protein